RGEGNHRTKIRWWRGGKRHRQLPLHQLRWFPPPSLCDGEELMRIIAGAWRGRTIEAPPGQATRPTADRVRETLFSMLASRLGSFGDLRVADLFAGSGALGFEALSRGAASATLVEKDAKAAAAIRRNAEKLGAADRIRIFGSSALALPRSDPYDLIFAD